MLSGYQRTNLQGLGCGIDTQCGCDKGLGDLLDPSTWGPADWVFAITGGILVFQYFRTRGQKQYARRVRRRLGADE